MLSTSSLSSKGQLTLPRRVREYLDVEDYFKTLPPLAVPFDKQALEEKIAADTSSL
jgi:hypothetical protein